MNSRGLLIFLHSYRDRFVSDWTTFSQNMQPRRGLHLLRKNRLWKTVREEVWPAIWTCFRPNVIRMAQLIRRRFVKLWTVSKSHIRWHLASDLGSLWSRSFYFSPIVLDLSIVCGIMAAFSTFYDQARSFEAWLRLILSSVGFKYATPQAIIVFK